MPLLKVAANFIQDSKLLELKTISIHTTPAIVGMTGILYTTDMKKTRFQIAATHASANILWRMYDSRFEVYLPLLHYITGD